MTDLPKGYTIQTKSFKKIIVDRKLGEGGQGAVYQVEYDGQAKALKWYSGKKIKNPPKFYSNLENNIKIGKPAKSFLWPEDITEKHGEAFGYIMDLRPVEYRDFSKFLLGKEGFASITAMANAALHITAGFRELHLKGFSYQDLNDGNFFINPKNGDVLICDNDNVSEFGKNSGIAGKARYMAPEIVAKGAKPDKKTDYFSLSVVLFLLWNNNHPLEGKAACPVCMDAKHEKAIYGENPVFIFDPDDKSNIPVQGLHKGAITRWPFLPGYLKEKFTKAFSKDLLKNPANRIIEQEWLRVFIRMRSEIFKCPCGEVYFADPVNRNPCPECKKKNELPMYIKTYRYNVPVHQRTKLYACHTEKDSDDFETLEAEVAAKGNDYELKNVSAKNWMVTDGDSTISVAPNTAFTLKKGMTINFGQVNAEII
ncbi:MAG: serine/threonine-protein kinase [Treponema sp.]|jgi:serine/threonine protein kinase|nr:serine/threonine-protein kinase [Treponema sp.]